MRSPRQLQLRKNVELKKYGLTKGCPRCERIRGKRPEAGSEHSPECRKRIEDAIRADPESQSFQRIERRDGRFAKRMADTEEDVFFFFSCPESWI